MNIDSMIQGNPQALVTSYNGVLVADSLEVADRFGKRHTHVLRSIDDLINQLESQSTQNWADYFIPDDYQDNKNRTQRRFKLTRDGFSLLVMGFTGPAALHWKLLYIEAFNKMEQALRSNVDIRQLITQITTDVLRTVLPDIRQAVEPPPEIEDGRVHNSRRLDFLYGNDEALPNFLTVYDIWIENDAHVPKVGEGVLYYWKDGMNFATTDCTGVPDHVGTVTEVYEKAGYFVVTEGNYSNAVKKRTMLINGRYIRGFISPKYTDDTVTPVTPAAGKDLTTVAREVILGVWGNMPERKTKLEASGYNFTDVQNKVNELLNKNVPTPSKPQNTGVTKVVAGSGAASFDKSLAGSYVTTTGLYMRHGAGKNKRAMVLIPEGTKVQNYGYYTSYNGTKWLYIQVTLNGVQYTGFSCKTYLKKQ